MNNKGFSLVELLAAVLILGIITMLSVMAYTKYLSSTRLKAYDTMAESAANAAVQYSMEHIGVETVTFAELVEGQYLEYTLDPASKTKKCSGQVDITHKENYEGIDTEEYDVLVCCATYNYKYHFPGGKKIQYTCP